jgi:hypothetical protein
MLRPSDERILAMWDEGVREHAIDRALTILSAFTGESKPALARLSIGKRDELLVRARIELLGPTLASYAECPHCGDRLEFALPSDTLVTNTATDEPPSSYRLPDSFDLAAIAGARSVEEGRRLLLERCGIAEADAEEVLAEMARREAAAAAAVDLTCPSCAEQWTLSIDIASFFWEELTTYAKRRLREVDALARAYGWTEDQILRLSPVRRAHYLEMVI